VINQAIFDDDDLATPKHDRIMLWLDEHLEEVIQVLTGKNPVIYEKVWEFPLVVGKWQNIAGYIDMKVCAGENRFLFEVKPNIPSLGALLRQLRKYTVYAAKADLYHAEVVVVSPDTRWVSILKEQGFRSIEVPPEVLA
jgi:hypothetical protein